MGRALVIDIQTKDAQTLAALKRIEGGLSRVDKATGNVKRSGKGLGDLAGGLALAAGIRYATNEFEEAEVAARSTEAVIRSTGNAAEVSAAQQDKLTTSLSKLAGVDDDVVNSAANMLRTFTEIKGENFGEALAASMDLAAFKGQDLASTAELIGKALNDPLKGYTKLTRAGVVFTDQQVEMIRTMSEAGDVAGAQQVILEELGREYGGQAEAAATSSGRMKVAAGEAAESVGAILAPALEAGADAAEAVATAFDKLPKPVQTGALALLAVSYAGPKVVSGLASARDAFRVTAESASNMTVKAKTAATNLIVPTRAVEGLGSAADGATKSTSKMGAAMGALGWAGVIAGAAVYADSLTDIKVNTEELLGATEDGLRDAAIAYEAMAGEGFGNAFTKIGETDITVLYAMRDALGENYTAESKLGEAITEAERAEKQAAETKAKHKGKVDELTTATGDLEAATSDYGASLKDAIDGSKDHRDSMTDELDAMFRLHAEARKGIDGVMSQTDARSAYENAVLSAADADQALADTLADSESTANDIAQARQRLTDAIVSQANAADDLAQANATAEGTQYDAGQAAIVLQGEFEKARQTTGFWNDDLQTTVDGLEDVSKPYKIQLDAQRALSDMHDLIAAMLTVIGLWGHVVTTVGDEIATGVSTIIGVVESGPTKTGNVRAGTTINVANMRVAADSRDLDHAVNRANVRTGRRVLAGAW